MKEDLQNLEAKLWTAADKLRGNLAPSDYKYVVLGLIFLKYVSDSFNEQVEKFKKEGFDPNDEGFLRDFLRKDNVFFVPPKARWEYLRDHAKTPQIGQIIDQAMEAIEHDNKSLKGVLPKNYATESLDKRRLGELIDLFSDTHFTRENGKDLLGRVYEYFMGMFADSEGKHGGEFFTPRSIVNLLVNMIEPFKGRVYDPCCGSGGMFVSSEDFVTEHAGRIGDIAVYGQELNTTTWQLAKMNMAIRGIDADIRREDTLLADQFKDMKFDYILANPPFNISDWGQEHLTNDVRWKYGLPPRGNANYAWIQHMIYHLSPDGVAGFVLANGSMSSTTSGEGDIRRKIIEADLVDAIVTLPPQLFFNVAIPCCLWFIARDRKNRSGKTLFIDGRNLGHMVSRKNRELSADDIKKVTDIYHKFKQGDFVIASETKQSSLDIAGFAKVASREEIAENDYVLTPGRYVGFESTVDENEDIPARIAELKAELEQQFAKSHELEEKIKANMEKL